MDIEITGIPELEKALRELDSIQFDAIVLKQTSDLLRRARQPGGTPVDTGEMRQSSSTTRDEMGYTVEYAPPVEFGHRVVVAGTQVGYVYGQHFLERNVDTQRPIYKNDLLEALNKVKK